MSYALSYGYKAATYVSKSMQLADIHIISPFCLIIADDSDGAKTTIDFAAYKDVHAAFDDLFVLCKNTTCAVKISNDHFKIIRNLCLGRASEPLRSSIKLATDTQGLFKIFAENKKYCNCMDVRFLKVIAIGYNNEPLQLLIESYLAVIYSKPLCEIWTSIPDHSARDKCYSEVKVIFSDKNPDNVTLAELMEKKSGLALEIGMLIAGIEEA